MNLPAKIPQPFFKQGDYVLFGDRWEWTGRVVRCLRKAEGYSYVLKYWVGKEARFTERKEEELKLRMREVV